MLRSRSLKTIAIPTDLPTSTVSAPSPVDVVVTPSPVDNGPVLAPTFAPEAWTNFYKAGCWGDPHCYTFDGLEYDCQGIGDFTLIKSLESPDFEIQARFS